MFPLVETVGYLLLFAGPFAFVFVPVMMVWLIMIDPFLGRVIDLVTMSLLLTFTVPARFRMVAAMALPQFAINYAIGGDRAAFLGILWAAHVFILWSR